MIDPTPHLRVVGASLIALAIAHLYFARHLNWKTDAARLSPVNRQVFHVHTFFICLTLVMMGVLALGFPETLTARTPLARLVLLGHTAFWAIRLLFQWFVYDTALWRGHRLNTAVHLLFTLVWVYFTFVYAVALRLQYPA